MMNDAIAYDLIVVGGGPVSLSTAYHAAKRDLKTLVIDRGNVLSHIKNPTLNSRHSFLSSPHQSVTELGLIAERYWSELQRYNHQEVLLNRTGGLWMGQSNSGVFQQHIQPAMDVMDKMNIAYQSHSNTASISEHYSFSHLADGYSGFSQGHAGVINMAATERALFHAALCSGLVDFAEWQDVIDVESVTTGGIHVYTQCTGDYSAPIVTNKSEKVVIACGASVNQITGNLGLASPINIEQMVSAYYRTTTASLHLLPWVSFQETQSTQESPDTTTTLYGFPQVYSDYAGYIRLLAHQHSPHTSVYNPADISLPPDKNLLDTSTAWVEQFMPEVEPVPCFVSSDLKVTPQYANKAFYLDYMPDKVANNRNLIIYAGSNTDQLTPLLGDMICQMVENDYLKSFEYSDYAVACRHFAIDWEIAK